MMDIVVQKKEHALGSHTFSILIPTWNNLAYLQLCVASIRKNSHFRHQIIVHVNEGKDGTLAWVAQQPDLDYTYSEENIGVCYALNLGRSLIRTDYVVYMNDDMYVCPNWDLELYREIEKIGHRFFFLSATAIEPVASSNCAIEWDCGKEISTFDEQKLLAGYHSLPMHDWQGATWPPNIVHINVWDLVGGYSVEFSPGMYSDPDFSMKLWQMGIRLFKGVSHSRVYHFGSRSTRRVVKNKGYYTFIQKWGITSSTLTLHYLRRGAPFDGPLTVPAHAAWLRLKNLFKRLACVLRGN